MTRNKQETLPKSQSDRFIETARELGADQDADALDRVFGKVVPPVLPITQEDTMDNDRIPERTIAREALRLLSQASDGFLTTTDLVAALERKFEPTGFDAEILAGRSDTRFSQKVRNLVSHRDDGSGLEANGLAAYDRARRGWMVTDKGRAQE